MLKSPAGAVLFFLLGSVGAEGHFLWRVEGEQPSYLYGTVHSSDPKVREIPPEILEAVEASVSFHPELEFSPENMGRLTAAIFASGTDDLEKSVPPHLWEKLLESSRRAGLPEILLRKVPMELTPLLFASPPDADFDMVVDVQIYRLARENKLSMEPLETVEEQVGIFRTLDRESALALLEDALREFEDGFPSQEKILQLYAKGDLDTLSLHLDEELSRLDLPGLAEELLDRRNARMVERFLPFLEKGGAFMAVGVGHLPGERGILSLLKEHGYQIVRTPLRGVRDQP